MVTNGGLKLSFMSAVASRQQRMFEALKNGAWRKAIFRIAVYVLLFDFAFVFVYPFLYVVVTSIKTYGDLNDILIKWIPNSIYLKNYQFSAYVLNYWHYLGNSSFVTGLSMLGQIICSSFVAYGFARFRFKGRNALFMVVILTFIVPVQVLIMPLYITYHQFRWLDSFLPLIVPNFFGLGLRGGLFIFIFRQFFLSMPYELEDSAYLDGCSTFQIYRKIMMPLAQPAILVTAILSMVWHWNDYYEPAMYIASRKLWMLPMNLPEMYSILDMIPKDEYGVFLKQTFNLSVIMAATFLVILPVLIVYLVLQRRFMESIERSGLVG